MSAESSPLGWRARARATLRSRAVWAFVGPVLLLLPFCGKAFHIDDTHFLRMAQHLHSAPMDYFGYEIFWNGYLGRGFDTNYNPPGVGYLLALLGGMFGWREIPLHLAMAIIAGLGCLGTYRLAQRCGANGTVVAVALAASPGFIVSSNTLMSDVPMLTLYVWALYFWTRGIDEENGRALCLSGLLMGAAIITKYFGLTAIPLAAVYAIARQRRPGLWCLALLIPVGVLILYGLHTQAVYGRDHFQFAGEFARVTRAHLDHSLWSRWFTVVPYLGTAMLPLAFFFPALDGVDLRRLVYGTTLGSLILSGVGPISRTLETFYGVAPESGRGYAALALAGMGVAAATFVLAAVLALRRRDAWTALLVCWLSGSLVYAAQVAPVLGVRVILPAIPACALIVGRGAPARMASLSSSIFRIWVPAAAAVLCAVLVLRGDYRAAERGREAAERVGTLPLQPEAALHYWGGWGFQYYMEEAGAAPLVPMTAEDGTKRFDLRRGMVVVVPQMYEPLVIPPRWAQVVDMIEIDEARGWTTWDAEARAGFYGEFLGKLPIAFAPDRTYHYVVYRVNPAGRNAAAPR